MGEHPLPAGWYSRGYLPHLDAARAIQHVTFHLADSLPRDALARMQAEVDLLPEDRRVRERRRRIHDLLDSGHGACLLKRPDCAGVVQDALLFGDGDRYRLLAWVVMPNHVHVLIEQQDLWPLAKVVQSWKRHTARQIHRLGHHLVGLPAIWQRGLARRGFHSVKRVAKVLVQAWATRPCRCFRLAAPPRIP